MGLETENHPAHLTVGVTLAAGRSPAGGDEAYRAEPTYIFSLSKASCRTLQEYEPYSLYSHEMNGDMSETAILVQDIFKQIWAG